MTDLADEQVWEQLELRAAKLVDVLGQFGILADLDEADEDAGGGLSREEKLARGIALDSDEEDEELSDSAFDGIDDMSDSEASGSEEVDEDDDESPLSDPDVFDDSAFPSADEEEDDFAGLDYGDEEQVSEEDEDEEDDTHRRITDLDAPGSKRDARRCVPTCAAALHRAGRLPACSPQQLNPFALTPLRAAARLIPTRPRHSFRPLPIPFVGRTRRSMTPSSQSTPSTARPRSSRRLTSPLARSAPTSPPRSQTTTTMQPGSRCPLTAAWTMTRMTRTTTRTTLRS